MAESSETCAGAEGIFEGGAEGEECVFCRVVVVNWKIALVRVEAMWGVVRIY